MVWEANVSCSNRRYGWFLSAQVMPRSELTLVKESLALVYLLAPAMHCIWQVLRGF